MPRFTRVRGKALTDPKHEFSVVNVDPSIHEVIDRPAEDSFGRQLPAKHHITKGGAVPVRPDTDSGSTSEKKEAQK